MLCHSPCLGGPQPARESIITLSCICSGSAANLPIWLQSPVPVQSHAEPSITPSCRTHPAEIYRAKRAIRCSAEHFSDNGRRQVTEGDRFFCALGTWRNH